MKKTIVYYTRPSFLDTSLPLIRELSHRVELHVLLELSPQNWQSSLFDVTLKKLPSGIVSAEPLLSECFPPGVRLHWENAASFNLVVYNWHRGIAHPATWWVNHKTARFVRALKPALIHFEGVSLRLFWLQLELRRIPVVLSIHDAEPHSGERDWRSDLGKFLTFRRVGQFILHNKALQKSFQTRHSVSADKLSVIPFGVCDVFREWANESVSENDRTVLFFGRLSPYKGLEVLYQAAPLVAQNVPDVRFIVAGRPVQGYHPPTAPALPNGGRIEVIDQYIPNDHLAQLFQKATMVVCPYVDATQSGVVLTAYAFGKPVIATTVGGLPEYVEDGKTGCLVPPRDPDSLSEAITRLLQNPMLRQQMCKHVKEKANTSLSWKRVAEQTLSIYERIARNCDSSRE